MRNKSRQILRYTILCLGLLVIGVLFSTNWNLLSLKLNALTEILLVFETWKIKPVIDAMLPLLTLIISSVLAIATCLYLLVTWRLLVSAHKEHKENQRLTQKLHSDSLTPYIYIKSIQDDLFVTSKTNPTLRVRQVTLMDKENKILEINSIKSIPLNNLIIKGSIKFKMNNASSNTANCLVSIHGICGDIKEDEVIRPGSTMEYIFKVENQLHDPSKLISFLSNKESITISASAKGPGLSADDSFEAKYPIKMKDENEPVIISEVDWTYTKRLREYDEYFEV